MNPIVTNGNRKEDDGFICNKDADMMQCPAGELSVKKLFRRTPDEYGNQQHLYYFNVENCKNCPLKEGCYKGGKKKTYSVRVKTGAKAEHEEFMKTDEFKEKAKERYKIEAKNSELKNQHGYGHAVGGGIHNMGLQSALTVFAVNLKRIFKLMDEK